MQKEGEREGRRTRREGREQKGGKEKECRGEERRDHTWASE